MRILNLEMELSELGPWVLKLQPIKVVSITSEQTDVEAQGLSELYIFYSLGKSGALQADVSGTELLGTRFCSLPVRPSDESMLCARECGIDETRLIELINRHAPSM